MAQELTLPDEFHLAIIMDGNGRWAIERGLSRNEGHEAGLAKVNALFEAAQEFGVKYISLYAFSTENWKRSQTEISGLMWLFRRYIREQSQSIHEKNVKIRFIGVRERFSKDLIQSMNHLEELTKDNQGLYVQVALNYGGHDEILRAANKAIENGAITSENFERALDTYGTPAVDFLIRTSGEERISNFLLWQIAYAELYFTKVLWPDFGAKELKAALYEYQNRDRRMGGS